MKEYIILVVLSLFLLQCSGQSCNKTVYVNVTSSGSLTLPMVNQVVLWTAESSGVWTTSANDVNVNGDTYVINSTNMMTNWYALTIGTNIYNITIQFNGGIASCQNITLDLPVYSRSFTCIPVSSCNDNTDLTMNTITWKRAYYMDDDSDNENEYEDLVTGPYSPPSNVIGLSDRGGNIINITSEIIEGNRMIQNATLTLTEVNGYSAGYYIAVNDNAEVLYQYTMYYGPVQLNHGDHESSAKATLGQDYYKGLQCAYGSFPNSIVTWSIEREDNTRDLADDSNVNLYNVTIGELLMNVPLRNGSELFDFSWTGNGGLEIIEVNYDYAGTFTCTASNGYETTSVRRRLRVRSPLRPLWPILGIIASFAITAVFIFGGFIVDKIRGDSKNTIDQEEMDGAFRPLSVNSFNEEETVKDFHRRTSSAKELLSHEQIPQ